MLEFDAGDDILLNGEDSHLKDETGRQAENAPGTTDASEISTQSADAVLDDTIEDLGENPSHEKHIEDQPPEIEEEVEEGSSPLSLDVDDDEDDLGELNGLLIFIIIIIII